MARPRIVLRDGALQSLAAMGIAGVIAGVISLASSARADTAGSLALLGVGVLLVALVFGSRRLVAIATLPILAAALIVSAAGDEPAWIRSIVLGTLWYLTAELAWEGIERRDGVQRSDAFNSRRLDEVTTVVALTLAVTTIGASLAFLAPARSVFAMGLIFVGLLIALGSATRRIRDAVGRQE